MAEYHLVAYLNHPELPDPGEEILKMMECLQRFPFVNFAA
jgi:hypothetical protein